VATLSPAFSADSKRIHSEHQTLLSDLVQFERALDSVDCYSEVFANLAAMGEVARFGRRLNEQLPEHFTREEEKVLVPVAQVSPELSDLVQELKREHQELRARLAVFSLALQELESADDLYDAIWQVKELGKELTREITRHVALEESELEGFL
jgi:iron-sulfur cluster repair protein YtfE (RIC family)